LLAGCQAEVAKKEPEPASVRVVPVKRAPASIHLAYTATLRGSVEVRVFSQIPDRIRALYVDQGDVVKQGQLLAVITHNALSSGLEAALAGQNSAAAQLSQLRSERDRLRKLFTAQAVGEAQVDRIEKQVQSAEAGVRQLEALVNQAATQQGKAFVRAPIDGVVGQRYVEQGDMAVPQIPLVTIVQMDELKAELMVPEFELPRIEKAMQAGYPVRVSTAGVLGQAGARVTIPARIVRISPTIDLVTRMAMVEVRIDNRDRRLRPGMLAEVEVVVEKNDAALLVPAYAVLSEGAVGVSGRDIKHVVYTVESGKARRKPVILGMRLTGDRNGDAGMVEVVEGLEEGAAVVIRGQHLLQDADSVQVRGAANGTGSAGPVPDDPSEQGGTPGKDPAAAPKEGTAS
jgi:RND family efflux transporter MFP subunit